MHEYVHAEAAQAGLGDREVELELLHEVLALLGGHERERGLADGLGCQDLLVDRQDLTFDLDLDGRVGGEEQVGGLLLHHQLEKRLGVEGRVAGGAVQGRNCLRAGRGRVGIGRSLRRRRGGVGIHIRTRS